MTNDKMDVAAVLDKLNAALVLQYRSALQFALAAGHTTGLEYQFLTDRLWEFAAAELADLRRLVEKITALGGAPATRVDELRRHDSTFEAIDWLIETEGEAIDALRSVIPHSGDEGGSEALEHLMEHVILRKQSQVDFMTRARRSS